MLKKKSGIEKEWHRAKKQERSYLQKHMAKDDSRLNRLLQERMSDNLQDTLDAAFYRAFQTIFEKGAGLIERTYDKEKLQTDHQVRAYTAQQKKDRKSLQAFSKKAKGTGRLNTVLSGVSGVGLGLLGIGIPDIFLFTGMMLKNIYEIALHYGFEYEEERERRFILLLIRGALSNGEALGMINGEINGYIDEGVFSSEENWDAQVRKAAQCLSRELLYMKFLQGIPVAGAIGGAYDALYMKRIAEYAELKYRQRFYGQRIRKRR